MDRRRILFMTLAGIAASPALAQSSTSTPPSFPNTLGEAERKHIHDTLEVGGMSLALSSLALTQATEPKVKEFAQFEVAEQETIAGILKPLNEGAAPVDPMLAEMTKKLKDAGDKFDKDYVAAEIQGHNKLLQIQDSYLSSGKVPSHIDVAKLARGMILEHLTLLGDRQKDMRG